MAVPTQRAMTFRSLRQASSIASRRLPREQVAAMFVLPGQIPVPVPGICFIVPAATVGLPGAVKRRYRAMSLAIATSHPRALACPMATTSRWPLTTEEARSLPGARREVMQDPATSGPRTTESHKDTRECNIEKCYYQEGTSMARDAKNMPFPRSTSYQESDTTEHSNDSNGKLDASLKIENMLLEEFNYASLTAYQSMEDRARISSFYYVLLGVLASAPAAIYQLNQRTPAVPQFLVIGLLMVGAIISITFF